MKIVVIVPYLITYGGAARFAWEFSEYLVSKGDNVIVASLFTDRKMYSPKKNLQVIDIGDKNSFTQTMKFWVNLHNTRKNLSNLIIKENPDAVLFNHFPSTLWAQKFENIPIFCYPHDVNLLYEDTYTKNLSFMKNFTWKFFRYFVRIYEKQLWKNFDLIISNSNFTSDYIKRIYIMPVQTLNPGVDITLFSPSVEKKERAIIVFADHKTRRADFLLKTIGRNFQGKKDFKIWIVGNHGNYDKELHDIVKNENLTNIVEFYGRISDSILAELYSKSLLLVHLQRVHPFGYIYIEAMACGTPVIACKPGASEEVIIHDETGFLIEDNDSGKLVEYIKKILDDPNRGKKMGEAGRKRVKTI